MIATLDSESMLKGLIPGAGGQINGLVACDQMRKFSPRRDNFGKGGGFNNGFNSTLSMSDGTWAGNSISDNLNYRHFINITHLVQTIPGDKPSEAELFQDYWQRYGR